MSKATENEQAVAPVEANGQLPQGYDLQDIIGDAGAGTSDMGAGDLGIPYLAILQTNSPQVNPAHSKYIEGARAGWFMNTATNKAFPGPIEVIPCAYERKYVEWKDRDAGEGGYVQDHALDSGILAKCSPNSKGKPALPNGNVIWETAYQYVLVKNPESGRWDQMVMPLKSTALKQNRLWNNLIADATIPGTTMQAPRWMFPYTMKTTLESKNNNSWFGPVIEREGAPVTAEAYAAGKKFHQQFASGQVQRAAEGEFDDDGAPAQGVGQRAKPGDDEIPY